MAATQFRAGHVSLAGCLLIIMLAADFFIPMRQLGNFFHIAMNGMAACDNLHFSYKEENVSDQEEAHSQDQNSSMQGTDASSREQREVLLGINRRSRT